MARIDKNMLVSKESIYKDFIDAIKDVLSNPDNPIKLTYIEENGNIIASIIYNDFFKMSSSINDTSPKIISSSVKYFKNFHLAFRFFDYNDFTITFEDISIDIKFDSEEYIYFLSNILATIENNPPNKELFNIKWLLSRFFS